MDPGRGAPDGGREPSHGAAEREHEQRVAWRMRDAAEAGFGPACYEMYLNSKEEEWLVKAAQGCKGAAAILEAKEKKLREQREAEEKRERKKREAIEKKEKE